MISALRSAKKRNPQIIPLLEGLMHEGMIKKSRLRSSFRSQLGVHRKFGQKDRPIQYASYRKASNKTG